MSERCFISLVDLSECIETNDFLCIGFDMGSINIRTNAFSIISYKTFIKTNKNIYGPGNENINHIFPLFLNDEHWSIVKNNLDEFFQRYDMHKYPYLVLSSIRKRLNSEYFKKIHEEIKKVCLAIIDYYDLNKSIKTELEKFINEPQNRNTSCLTNILVKQYLIYQEDDISLLKKVALIVIEEQLKRFVKKLPQNIILELLGINVQEYIKKYFISRFQTSKNIIKITNKIIISPLQKKFIDNLDDLFNTVVKQAKLIESLADPKKIFGKQFTLNDILTPEQILAMGLQFYLSSVYREVIFNMDLADEYLKTNYKKQIEIINNLCEAKLQSEQHLLSA